MIDQSVFPVTLAIHSEPVDDDDISLFDLLHTNEEGCVSDLDTEQDDKNYETVLQLMAKGLSEQEDPGVPGSFQDCIDLEIQDRDGIYIDQYTVGFMRTNDGNIDFSDLNSEILKDIVSQWVMQNGDLDAFTLPVG